MNFKCADCDLPGYGPMLVDSLWEAISKGDRMLCPGCMEARMGRPFKIEDLAPCLMNVSMAYFIIKLEKAENGKTKRSRTRKAG